MSTQSNAQLNAMPESRVGAQAVGAPNAVSPNRLMYWSVVRELWENRAVYIAPVSVACLIVFAFVITLSRLRARLDTVVMHDIHAQQAVQIPFDVAAALLIATGFITAVFYCLDALYGERKDRSILFWKSLPVSDLTTVVSKFAIAFVVLPAVTFMVIVATHIVMALLSMILLAGTSLHPLTLLADLPLVRMWIAMVYAFVVMSLWFAPIFGWLLIVSGWAPRATFLCAVLPPFAVGAFEKIAFSTNHFAEFMKYRLFGWYQLAFLQHPQGSPPAMDPLSQITAGKFLSTPGVWLGLVVAAAFLAGAIRMRRYRGPV